MKMKNLVAYAMLALGAVVAPFAALAVGGDGDIAGVHVLSDDAVFPNDGAPGHDKALRVGQKFYILVRMLNEDWGDTYTAWEAHKTNPEIEVTPHPWYFKPLGTSTEVGKDVGIGILVGSRQDIATYAAFGPQLKPSGPNAEYPWFTDLYFEYTVKPGDLGLPVQIRTVGGGSSGTHEEFELLNARTANNGAFVVWPAYALTNDSTAHNYGSFFFWPDVPPTDFYPAYPGNPYRQYDLTMAGVYVQTIDFDNINWKGEPLEEGDDWRRFPQVVNGANPEKEDGVDWPSITSDGSATVYVWSDNDSIAYVVPYGAGQEYYDDGSGKKILKVSLSSEGARFKVAGVGPVDSAVEIYMSQRSYMEYTKVGDKKQYSVCRRTVRVTNPKPPSVSITWTDESGRELSSIKKLMATNDYEAAVRMMKVTISKVYSETESLDVDLVSAFADAATIKDSPTNGYIRILQKEGDPSRSAGTNRVTIAKGATSATFYLYPLGVPENRRDGVETTITPSLPDPAARAFFTGGMNPMVIERLVDQPPEIVHPAPGTVYSGREGSVIDGFDVEVTDNWRDLQPALATNGYEIVVEGMGVEKFVTNGVHLTDGGIVTLPVKVSASGTALAATVKVKDPAGNVSTREVTINSTPKPKSRVQFYRDSNGQNPIPHTAGSVTFTESEQVYPGIVFTEGKPPANMYAYLVPLDANATNLVNCGAVSNAVSITTIATNAVWSFSMSFADGYAPNMPMKASFAVRFLSTPTLDEAGTAIDYTDDCGNPVIDIYVANDPPSVTGVKLDTESIKDGGRFRNVPSLIAKTYRAKLADPSSIDLKYGTGYEGKEIWVRWEYTDGYEGWELSGSQNLYSTNGLNNYAEGNISFTYEGTTQRVRLYALDKDERAAQGLTDPDELEWGEPKLTFYVEVAAAQRIVISDKNKQPATEETELIYLEDQMQVLSQASGDFYISLSDKPGSSYAGQPGISKVNPLHVKVTLEKYGDGNFDIHTNDVYFTSPTDMALKPIRINTATLNGGLESVWYLTVQVVDENVAGKSEKMKDADGHLWSEHFAPMSCLVRVRNVPPAIDKATAKGSRTWTDAATNTVAVGDTVTVNWKLSDITNDFVKADESADKFQVEWSVDAGDTTAYPNPQVITNGWKITKGIGSKGTIEGAYQFNVPDLNGYSKITMTVSDGDGGFATKDWWIYVAPSKRAKINVFGPKATVESKYKAAKGVGQGLVAAKGTIALCEQFAQTWEYDETMADAEFFAFGYPATNTWAQFLIDYAIPPATVTPDNTRDEGKIPGYLGYTTLHGVPLNKLGNKRTATDTTWYDWATHGGTDPDAGRYDSYFYRWVVTKAAGGEKGGDTEPVSPAPTFWPFEGSSKTFTLDAGNADNKSGPVTYGTVGIEAIFSKELRPKDNLGDINADGIPDKIVEFYGLGSGTVGEFPEDDLMSRANFNDDGDLLPNLNASPYARLIPGLPASWSESGLPFDARTEIRGYHEGLNDAPVQIGLKNYRFDADFYSEDVEKRKLARDYSELEMLSWALTGYDKNWSPERPTDPTLEDTDDDGLPDGYEYFFWYRAHVGALEVVNGKTNLVYLTGRRYDPRNPGEGKIITSAQIEKIFDPLVPLDGLTAKTMDTDNDGLPDLLEFELGTNPFDFDTDGDGLSDGWEIIVSGTDPLKAQTTLGTPDTMRNGDGDAMAFTTPALELGVDNPVPVSVETFWSFALQDENGATDGKQWYVMSRDYYDYFTNNIETVMETNETRNTALAFEYSVNNGRTWVKAARIGGITTVDIGGQLHVPVDTFDAFTYTNDQNRIIQLAAQRLPKGTLVRNIEKEALPLGYYCIATNLAGYCFSTAWVYGKSSVDTLIEDDLKKSSGYGMLCVGRQLCAKDQKETLGDFAKGDKLKKTRLAELPSESRTVAFIHYMVYQHYGFDPRTAWNPDMPLHPRWGATDKNDDGSVQYVENASRPARTREYAAYDEFLVLSFFLNNESVPLADVTADPLQVERSWTDIFTRMTTNPQGPMDELADFGDHFSGQVNPNGADTDSDGVPDGWELYVMAGPKKPGKFNGKNLPDPLFHIVGPDAFMGPWKAFAKQIDHTDVNSDPESGNGNGDNDGLTEWEEFSGTDTIPYYAEPWHANPVAFSTTISRPQNHAGWLNKFWPTDPWNADTDQDGISDEAESRSFAYGGEQTDDGRSQIFHGGGLNPLTVDTDLDGLPDPWEVQYAGKYDEANGNLRDGIVNGMDGTVPDAKTTPGGVNRDYDHDGLENWQEYLTGTMLCWRYDDPVSPRSPVPTEMMCSWDSMNSTWVFDPKLEYFGLDPDDPDAMNTFWYNLLVNVDSSYYNPHIVYGMSSGAMYFTRVKKAWDIAYEGENGPHGGSYYFFYDHSDYIKHYILSPQPQHWTLPYMMMFNVVPIQKYPCTDPRLADTDGDGMDDYYELFHGMNPLLGKSSELPGTGPCDIVAAAYGGAFISAYNDVGEAGNLFMMPGMASPMDFTSYLWLNGEARADPDGDDIRNQEESIMPMLAPSAVWHHTDPTPLWMTDSTYDGSLVNRFWQLPMRDIEVPLSLDDAAYFEYGGKRYYFYKFDCFARANLNVFPPIPARFTMFLPDHWRFAGPGLKNYMYSFEENEGFDTDHDGLNDFEELQGKMRPSSDPQYFDSPRRREAMYFPGKDAALQTLSQVPEIHPTNIEWMDEMAFLQYTVECWVKAEDTGREQTLVERAVCSPNSKAYDEEHVRSNFRLGIRDGRWYTKFDTRGTLVLSCVEAMGLSPVSTNWTHVAATFDGKSLRLYVNGTQEAKVDSQLQPDWGAHVVAVQENGEYLRSDEYDLTTILVGASVKTGLEGSPNPALAFTPQYGGGWSLYNRFFKGWIDEVRIWDGARSGDQIRGTMRTRFDDTLAKANRDEFWKDWSTGRYRYAKDGSGNDYQPVPELRYHWAFDSLPGAESPASVAREPHGYNTPAAAYSRPSAYKAGFWNDMLHGIHDRPWDSDDTPGYGSVYNNATWVPWIPNTVAHLPRYDGTTLDSFFQSEDFQGGVQGTYRFRRNAEPASRWTQLAYYTSIDGMVMLTGSVLSRYHLVNHLETPGTGFPLLFEFTGRHLNQVGDDLLPLGGAYVRYCETMWDGQGASTMWEVNGTDSDGDGLPDWWEEYARANWGQGLAPGETFGWNDPITRNGVTRTAGEWYLRDLANGATPRKPTGDPRYRQTADEDSNGIPDWWADLYGIRGESGLDDHDNDGLPNYVEYLLTEVFRLRGIVFDPTVACSIDVNTPDYFYRPEGSQLCVGEIFTDHDLVDDAWEDLYPESYASRLAWDAFADADEDGWSNRSENRYSKMVLPLVANVQAHNTSADGQLADYPIPTLALTLRYNGNRQNTVRTAPITIHVTTDAKYVRDPDAIFRVGATDDPATEQKAGEETQTTVASTETSHVRTLGRWTNRRVVGTLTPGNINRDSVVLEACFDPASDVRNWNVLGGPTKRGTCAEYEEDIRRYGEANVTLVTDSTGYTEQIDFKLSSDPTGRTATWIWTSTGKVFGTIDLITGEFEIDLGLLKGERMQTISTNSVIASYEDQTYRIAYTANASSGLPRNLYLGEATTGHVREGKNTIVAWADLNGDGVWDVGEPYGMVRDVDVSWRGTSAEIELTDISPVTPRINLVGGGAGDGQKAPTSAGGEKQDEGDPDAVDENSDRGKTVSAIKAKIREQLEYEYSGASPVLYSNALERLVWMEGNVIDPATITADTFRNQRLRVVRWLINDVPTYRAGTSSRVVLDKKIETDVRSCLTEADFLVGNGSFDLDWDNLYDEVIDNMSVSRYCGEVRSVSYLVVVGDGPVDWDAISSTNYTVKALDSVIVRKYGENQVKPEVVSPGPAAEEIVRSANPTFKWRVACPEEENYTAFSVQVLDGTKVIYDSDKRFLPPRDMDGTYSWTAPLFVGDKTPKGEDFENKKSYTWQVSVYNAKFSNTAVYSNTGKFLMDVQTNGYVLGTANVAVRYFGPTSTYAKKSPMIRVRAYTSPDFTGTPSGAGYVADPSDTQTGLCVTGRVPVANCRIVGLSAGSYYLQAFIDSNGNGVCDRWETQGYLCRRDGSTPDYLNPTPITFGPTIGAGDLAVIYLEDADTDADGLPDAWEYAEFGSLTAKGVELLSETKAGEFMVNPELTGALELQAGALVPTAGLAGRIGDSLNNAGFLALAMGAPIDEYNGDFAAAIRGYVSPELVDDGVRITSLDLVDGKVSIKVEAETETAGSAWVQGRKELTVWCQVQWKPSITSTVWTDLGDPVEITVGTEEAEEVDISDRVPEGDSGYFSVKLYKK